MSGGGESIEECVGGVRGGGGGGGLGGDGCNLQLVLDDLCFDESLGRKREEEGGRGRERGEEGGRKREGEGGGGGRERCGDV